jgi:hypothetical protein
MQKHVIIYCKYFGYADESEIMCEICGPPQRAVDVHHIDARGMGGSELMDIIENLMGLCRKCHNKYGDIEHFKPNLRKIHENKMKLRPIQTIGEEFLDAEKIYNILHEWKKDENKKVITHHNANVFSILLKELDFKHEVFGSRIIIYRNE